MALASHRDGYFGKPESFWECFNRKAFEYEKRLRKNLQERYNKNCGTSWEALMMVGDMDRELNKGRLRF